MSGENRDDPAISRLAQIHGTLAAINKNLINQHLTLAAINCKLSGLWPVVEWQEPEGDWRRGRLLNIERIEGHPELGSEHVLMVAMESGRPGWLNLSDPDSCQYAREIRFPEFIEEKKEYDQEAAS